MSQGKPAIDPQTDAERVVVNQLVRLRDALAWTDAQFHRRFLNEYSYSAWIRVRQNKWSGNTRTVMRYYTRQLPLVAAFASRDREMHPEHGAEEYYITQDVQAVLDAVEIARRTRGQKRLVMYVAAPGGGKTALLAYLQQHHDALATAATRGWQRSYCAGLLAVGRALGVSPEMHSTYHLEQAVFQAAREMGSGGILAIDDANTFGPHTCDMVRDLCNHTRLTIVTASTDIPFSRQGRAGYQEGEQMRRRAVAIIKARPLTAQDVAPFLSTIGLNGVGEQAASLIAASANRYNRFDFVASVARGLKLRSVDGVPTLADVSRVVGIEAKKHQRDER